MITTPHFTSHEAQIEALGCAANLDPHKHPRRYAQYLAAKRFERQCRSSYADPEIAARDAATEVRAEIAERAKWYAGLTMSEAARALMISYTKLSSLKKEFNLTFAASSPKNSDFEICEAAESCSTYAEVAEKIGMSYSHCLKTLHKHGIYLRGETTEGQ